MTRFTDRVEHDLSQISDRATPSSSTAWETIRQRIDEQDSRATSGTEPTVEVIMLDPDINKYSKRPRTGLLVAASLAAITLIGGLIVVATRDGERTPLDRPEPTPTVPVTDPAIAGDPAPVDADENDESAPVVDPELEPSSDGEAPPQVEPLTQGAFVANCETGAATPDPGSGRIVVEQDCSVDGVGAQPFASDQVLELSLLEEVGAENSPAGAFVALGDNGFMNAGLLWDDGTQSRWVGIAEGIDDNAGRAVFLAASSSQDADGLLDEIDGQWWTDTGPRPGSSDDPEIVAEIAFTCQEIPSSTNEPNLIIECAYDGEDITRFIPESERFVSRFIPADFGPTQNGPNSVLSSDFISAVSEDGTVIRSGVYAAFRYFAWSGLRVGTGEFEGSLLHESGWAETSVPGDASSFEGVIQLSVIPVDA